MKKKLEELKLKRAELLEKSKRADVSNDELKTILDEVKKINESISLIEEIANINFTRVRADYLPIVIVPAVSDFFDVGHCALIKRSCCFY